MTIKGRRAAIERERMRFDDVPTEDLVTRERYAVAELELLSDAVRERLIFENVVEVGCSYRVTNGAFAGRRVLVIGKRVERSSPWIGSELVACCDVYVAYQRSKSEAGWSKRPRVVRAADISLSTEQKERTDEPS